MIVVNSISTQNIRELTKKEKILRLNLKSWFISFFGAITPQAYIGFLNAVFIFLALVVFFYIIEFFDDDIVDIALATGQIRTGAQVYYP
ncbi:hypothetical protein [Helicobacter sp. 10-6591]|uniref:hypothetical protein n=1 Tax=Helicobacter sp. 10-6591 TaxID=2004998 RepID=UPI000DCF5138|nr:hypothetical protein [Helicobacter sp. 10-6591]MCI7484358.1 hypothetical protein [Helicobacter sp.]RAX55453.1 hypothetical protein CCY97_04085 [Helicobacter sp. 10-6591]